MGSFYFDVAISSRIRRSRATGTEACPLRSVLYNLVNSNTAGPHGVPRNENSTMTGITVTAKLFADSRYP